MILQQCEALRVREEREIDEIGRLPEPKGTEEEFTQALKFHLQDSSLQAPAMGSSAGQVRPQRIIELWLAI